MENQMYKEEIKNYDLMLQRSNINVLQNKQLHAVALNIGLGYIEKKQILLALLALEIITGKKGFVTRAKQSIDKFKIREKMPIGVKVILGKKEAYKFLHEEHMKGSKKSIGIKEMYRFRGIQKHYERLGIMVQKGLDIHKVVRKTL